MAEVIRMPEVLAGATEAAIQTWLVSPGTVVSTEQTLAEIETEKAIVELAAESSGTIGILLAAEGDSVAVGDPLLVILAAGEDDSHITGALTAAGLHRGDAATRDPVTSPILARASSSGGDAAALRVDAAVPTVAAAHAAGAGPQGGERVFASPLVRKLAASAGMELTAVPGTGPNGRVTRRDLDRYLAAQEDARGIDPSSLRASMVQSAVLAPASDVAAAVGAAYEDRPLDRMRKAIARRLTESKSSVPHFYLVADCRVDELLTLRAAINEFASRKISVNDFILKAVAAALVDVPEANAIWKGDSIRHFTSVDIAVAVATEGGLTTPVLRAVERTPLSVVGATVADVAERARAGRLKQHELEGGSFAVSNLGMYGATQFAAILNPPQSGILAVGAARKAPAVSEGGDLVVATVMTVTLSADHRVLDGAVAAQWLAAFQRRIENPLTILV